MPDLIVSYIGRSVEKEKDEKVVVQVSELGNLCMMCQRQELALQSRRSIMLTRIELT